MSFRSCVLASMCSGLLAAACGGTSGTPTGAGGTGAGGSGASGAGGEGGGTTGTTTTDPAGGSGGVGGGAAGSGGAGGGAGGSVANVCGDNVALGDEECDGTDLKSGDCTLFGYSKSAGLACDPDCKLDITGCTATCDGVLLEAGEECDGVDLGNHDCVELGFTEPLGAKCNATCTGIVIGNCKATCDGAGLEMGEDCDGTDLDGKTCQDFGFDVAAGLACDAVCQLDETGCSPVCNGQNLEPGEACDGNDLGGKTCTDFGFANSAGLSCNGTCAFNMAGCTAVCGNQTVEPGEQCDGPALPGQSCSPACVLSFTTVINEVWYDPPGGDAASAQCFIEIMGTPGLDLTGYSLKFIDGGGGLEYVAALKLDNQTIGANGYFVVVQTAGQLASLPAGTNGLTSAKADMQQGPDNLVLVKGNVVVDALGYGNFVANFAGEGSAAQDPTDQPKTLSRLPNGKDTNDNSADFALGTPTPGASNIP